MKFISFVIVSLFLTAFAGQAVASKKARKPNSGSEPTSLRKILELEDRRVAGDKFLIQSVNNPSPKVARAAILALGRIGDASGLDEMARIMNRKGSALKAEIAFALGLIGGDTATRILVQHSQMHRDPTILSPILVAIGRAGDENHVSVLANFLKEDSDPKLWEPASHGLGLLWSGNSEKWGVPNGLFSRLFKIAQGGDSTALSAAFALARYKGDPAALPVEDLANAITKSQLVFARGYLIRAIARIKSPAALTVLAREAQSAKHPGLRVEGAKGMMNQDPGEISVAALMNTLGNAPPAVAVTALDTLASYGLAAASAAELVASTSKNSTSAWVRGVALKALARISPATARPRISEVLTNGSSPMLGAAVYGLAVLGGSADLDRVPGYLGHGDPKIVEEALEGLNQLPEESFTPPIRVAMKKALERGDVGITTLVAQTADKFKWKDFAPSLATVYHLFTQRDQIEAKVAVLSALGSIGDHSHLELFKTALSDPDRVVIMAAVEGIKSISGKDESARIPLNSASSNPTPSAKEIADSVRRTFVIKTNRGDITIRTLDDAPLNATNFARLAIGGFYKGKTFHRVVPNFVIQGGDPRGDGYGGPGYLVRDEFSSIRHSRGTVGMATAGKDTGGSQFFINVAPNPHLDGRYTIFAEVTSGMDIVDKIEAYDQINSVQIR